jgi:hypothetical protein
MSRDPTERKELVAKTADGRADDCGDPGDSRDEHWGASRGHFPDGHTPASRWPAPPESIVAAATPADLEGTRRRDEPGRPGRLMAILAALRGRHRRS